MNRTRHSDPPEPITDLPHWNDTVVKCGEKTLMEMKCESCSRWVWIPAYLDTGHPWCWMPLKHDEKCPQCGERVMVPHGLEQ